MRGITIGELKVILAKIPSKFNRNQITLTVTDDEAKGSKDAPGIRMEGELDYIAKPKERGDTLKLFAGGEACISLGD